MTPHDLAIALDPADRRPLYAQVEDAVAGRIARGELAAGTQLPPEGQLTEALGVSRTTIRQTFQNLVRRGLVEIRRGTGTFVAAPKITHELTALSGFVEDMEAQGKTATARVVGRAIVAASARVARQLGVRTGARVVRIQRVRLADGEPISFDDTYLPRELGEPIMADALETRPIFELLEQKYATPLVEAEYRMEAVAAEAEIARALGVLAGAALFVIERTSYAAGHRAVDYEKLYYRGDRVRFTTRPARQPVGIAASTSRKRR
jgi:GntR family transcriptional regulator